MSRRALQVIVGVVACLFLFRFGLPGMIRGGAYVAGGAEVTSLLDSEVRFLSAVVVGAGIALALIVRDVDRHLRLVRIFAVASFLGGAARGVSMVLVGLPPLSARIAMGIEMLLPVAMIVLARLVEDKSADAARL
jgi:hypothetical protein